ncbi:MAG TPA: universal stress protein [Blastocatellia bacterium]|nr:universal stress protein [Blastocatellia bacterium]
MPLCNLAQFAIASAGRIIQSVLWGSACSPFCPAYGLLFLINGKSGHNRLLRFMLGSVTTAVVARAHCSVEVVHTEKSM